MINNFYLYLIYLFLALTPILFWLFFYFKKDSHPEPKKMVLKVFLLGMIVACLVSMFEMAFLQIFPQKSLLITILESFLLIGFVEEFFKYFVVKSFVFNSPELDEPLDIMLYMVISALGFAFTENILLFFAVDQPYAIGAASEFALLRFLGPVFLHTLTSGTIGFFIALSFCSTKNKGLLYFLGFLIAIVLHGIYNLALVQLSGFWQYAVPTIIVIILAIFTTYGFVKLRKLKTFLRQHI